MPISSAHSIAACSICRRASRAESGLVLRWPRREARSGSAAAAVARRVAVQCTDGDIGHRRTLAFLRNAWRALWPCEVSMVVWDRKPHFGDGTASSGGSLYLVVSIRLPRRRCVRASRVRVRHARGHV